MKIVIDDKIPFIQGVFEPYAQVVYVDGSLFTPALVSDADALIIRTRTRCNAALLQGSKVRFIATATIGYDHIDASYCAQQGIQWVNAAGCNSGAVQQYIACAILELAQRHGLALANTTLGIVGVGNVGSKVLQVAQALGMRTVLCDPPRERNQDSSNIFVPLNALLSQADIVSMHVPLIREGQDQTFHMVNDAFLGAMKPGSMLLNSSRGEVVDEQALHRHLDTGLMSACVLDVWENEPHIDISLMHKTTLATPHIAGYSAKGKATATQMAVQSVARFMELPLLEQWDASQKQACEGGQLQVEADGISLQSLISTIARHTYNISTDDANYRKEPLEGERLRGDYTYRQEFSCWTVALRNGTPSQATALRQMGFEVKVV